MEMNSTDPQPKPSPHTGDETIIRQLTGDFDAAWNNRDAARMAAFFIADGDFQFQTGAMLSGRAEIEAYYAGKLFPRMPPPYRHLTLPQYTRFVRSDLIIGGGEVEIYTLKDGEKKVRRKFLFTTVLVLEEKNWKIAAIRLMAPETAV
jgi:uncharacterized protein (TIGR02246 family)